MGTETSLHYDAGIFHRVSKNIDMRLSIYYIDITNYIVANTSGIYYPTNYAYNIDSAEFYGFEWEFNSTFFDKLVVFGNYTFREANYSKEEDLPSAFLLDLPPKHKANLNFRYPILKDTMLTADLRYMGKRKSEGGYTINDYFVTDVGMKYTLMKYATIRVYANNVFGEKYEEVYGYPMPDQVFGVRLELTFF